MSLYCMKCKRHVIALLYHYVLTIVVEAIVGETTTTLRWRSKCQAGDDGDHDGALEIDTTRENVIHRTLAVAIVVEETVGKTITML